MKKLFFLVALLLLSNGFLSSNLVTAAAMAQFEENESIYRITAYYINGYQEWESMTIKVKTIERSGIERLEIIAYFSMGHWVNLMYGSVAQKLSSYDPLYEKYTHSGMAGANKVYFSFN